jgi:hypothetical protein
MKLRSGRLTNEPLLKAAACEMNVYEDGDDVSFVTCPSGVVSESEITHGCDDNKSNLEVGIWILKLIWKCVKLGWAVMVFSFGWVEWLIGTEAARALSVVTGGAIGTLVKNGVERVWMETDGIEIGMILMWCGVAAWYKYW